MADYKIKLTPSTPEVVKFEGKDTFRVQIVASDAVDMPNEIFGHQRTPIDVATNTYQDEFVFVCTAYDLSTYPVDEPAVGQTPAFFRKDTMDILVPNVEVGEKTVAEVKALVEVLIQDLNNLDDLTAGEAVWIPAAACPVGFVCLDNGDLHTWAADTDFQLDALHGQFAFITVGNESFRVDNLQGQLVWDTNGADAHVFSTIGETKAFYVSGVKYNVILDDPTSLQFSVDLG